MHPSDFRITDTARSMQHIINLVSRGMTRWTGGTIPFEKAEHLVAKLDKKYEVLANEERHRTLRKNIACAMSTGHGYRRCRREQTTVVATAGDEGRCRSRD